MRQREFKNFFISLTPSNLRSSYSRISEAMSKSPNGTVEMNEDRTKLRRHPDNPLPEFNETRRKELLARTAYAKGFPLDSELSTLLEYFNNNFEKVEHLLMRKYFCTKTKKHLFKGSVFVTFATRELAENFVNKPELKYMEKELLRYTQLKYIEIKKKEKDDADKKKKAKKEAKELAADKEEFALPKSAVVHFSGADGDLSREDIKERVVEVDSGLEIAFIHFNKGDKEGEIRFSKANNGKLLLEKLEDAKVNFSNMN
jgi:lupus La protein